MKSAWFILLISALTDFVLAFAGGLTSGNANSQTTYPTGPTIFYSTLFALGVAFRTVQQALKATTADSAALRGIDVVQITKTPGQTVIAGTPDASQVARSAEHVQEPPPSGAGRTP